MRVPNTIISRLVATFMPADSKCLAEKLDSAYAEYRSKYKLSIPQVLISALLVAEDHRFYAHRGVDPLAILRAIWHLVYRHRLIGGSTIEQQLVRTLTGRKERTLKRKVRELALALCVSQCVPKSDVPGLYMSVAYFGWRMNGICEAYARMGVNEHMMTFRQAAEIVARLKYPEPNRPNLIRATQIRTRAAYVADKVNSLYPQLSPKALRLEEYETLFSDR